MTSRELLRNIINLRAGPRCGFWLGNPHPDTWPILHRYFGTKTGEDLRRKLGDDFRWISPQYEEPAFLGPEDGRLYGIRAPKSSPGRPGPLADAERPEDIEALDWPDPSSLTFSGTLAALREAGSFYRASGFWAPFFHDVMDLFGLEAYFVKMHTNPALVEAATARVCDFYLRANERFFEAACGLVDGFFFGNDFGTQLDLMIGLPDFDRFIMPWIRKFIDQARDRSFQVILHSCGAVRRVIPRLIEAGVQCLHPLQAMARNMDAESLSRDFGGKISFLGGIDTQRVLNRGTPEEVKNEVRRVKNLLGPFLIVSPSHEAILPDVPPRNIAAMAEAALGA